MMTSNFTNVRTMLNIDVLQHILSYNDDLRILKIKMNKQNIKYLFENIKELYTYLWCMKGFLGISKMHEDLCEEEVLYVDMIKRLSNKNYTMKEIKNHVLSLHDEECFDYFINMIINNYNHYYLKDKYYYNGYWWKEFWVIGEGKKFYDGYSRMMKTKMNEQNMKSLIENNYEIYRYFRCMEQSSFPPNIEEKIYLDIAYLMTDKKYTMEEIKNHILLFPPYNQHLLNPENEYHYYIKYKNWFDYFIAIIINNYHNYYLNDIYYDNGYWYENVWIKDDDKKFYHGYSNGFLL